MKKMLCALLVLALALCALPALADEPANVYALKGPTGIGMVGVMRDQPEDYAFTLCGAADEIVAAIASGSADIAACPTNLAATLYRKTNGGVQLLALNTLGVLHVVTSDETIDSIDDLAGRTVYATGQASVPEYVLSYILEQNGLSDSVTIEYVAEHSELATLLASGKADIGILPEPHVTSALMQNDSLRAALDVTALFDEAAKQAGNDDMVLSMGCVIVRRAFAEAHPEKVEAFLADYAASVAFVNDDIETASQLVESFGVLPKAAVAKRAIPNCHIVFVDGNEMRAQIEPLYELLLAANPQSIGGAMPGDDFYYGVQ
ncbi:MAG: PhnD/SsuA/transferrin family substrate-binding protein [Clostridia bacterium]|nr:PhnD/SsuA/transferrin family substrate-binding protein [Clostridia bacterium]